MDFVVGSYPFSEWARDVVADLEAAGVNADVFYAGPRAFQVVVSKSDAEKAGVVLSDIGYLTCSTRGASLSGIADWFPADGIDQDELKDEIERLVASKIVELGNAQAAMTWSTPDDDMVDKYGDPWYISDFDGQVAVNGDLFQENIPSPPTGFVLAHEGGRVPATEEEVSMDHVARAVIRDKSMRKYPKAMVKAITEEVIRREYKSESLSSPAFAYVSVSGETEIWVRDKDYGDE